MAKTRILRGHHNFICRKAYFSDMKRSIIVAGAVVIALIAVLVGYYLMNQKDDTLVEKSKKVAVTAYNTVPWQTKKINPDIAAWGDTLRPGMQAIAVSRDLLYIGLVRNTAVQIEGFEGDFIVLDKMNSRYKNRIDIYMGLDIAAAREWGVKKRNITWKVEKESKYDKRYMYSPDTTVVKK
jgi:3D (Asp-Asp-Asp) domain-containing protein